MEIKDFIDNPKSIALLIKAFKENQLIIEFCSKASDWDYDNNEGQTHRASQLLSIELLYPNNSWTKMEYTKDPDGEEDFIEVNSIEDQETGVFRIYDTTGEFTEWWISQKWSKKRVD